MRKYKLIEETRLWRKRSRFQRIEIICLLVQLLITHVGDYEPIFIMNMIQN
jgi:hypothetical protein